ncbi:hypothetical protein [Marinilabilia rubra]|uniref:DUF5020 domain-containing protein n=1 Tax=Marinilabilia rubra TaxID=2162893 RepID=A0A2U2B5C0_9BACT|nr:hypothetical protein [Marinilabilia rubra]PWD98256.1 hypothetical protein DDZ16_16625 [Marinilabilia rubra]
MKKVLKTAGLTTLIVLLFQVKVHAQEAGEVSLESSVGFCSRYVWRGLLFDDAPNIQPYIAVTWKNFTAATWGSYATSGNYAEVDLFLSYCNEGFTLCVNDYFTEDETDMSISDYSEWRRDETNHLIEAVLIYEPPFQNLPFQFTASSFVYGADLDDEGDQNFSTYFEVKYPFSFHKHDCNVFIGGTTHDGFYANDPGIVNLGVSATKQFKISESTQLPVSTSLTFNPSNRDVFFVFNISI